MKSKLYFYSLIPSLGRQFMHFKLQRRGWSAGAVLNESLNGVVCNLGVADDSDGNELLARRCDTGDRA